MAGAWDKVVRLIDPSGNVYAVKQIDGKPRVSSMQYMDDIGEGNVPGHTLFEKYAINDDVDKAAEEDIWSVGGTYSWLNSATTLSAVSSSVEDDPDKGAGVPGTGIWSIRIYYLDTSFIEKTTDVTLNGTTEVTVSANDIYRINRIRPLTIGTGLKAAGNIDVKLPAPASTVYTRIATGFNKGRQLIYTVPYGKTLYIKFLSGSIGGTTAPKYGRFTLYSTYDNISGSRNAWMTSYSETGQSSGFWSITLPGALKFIAGSDIKMSVNVLDDNCYVTGSIRGWLET